MLMNIHLDSGYHDTCKKLLWPVAGAEAPVVEWSAFAALWPLAPNERPDHTYGIPKGPVRMDHEAVQELASLGFDVVVVPWPHGMLVKKTDEGRRWSYGDSVRPMDLERAHAVSITIPDLALMYIDEVTNLDDECTDSLQRHLDDGWRILAVCPPNAQRRPDYILGRRREPERR